MTLTHHISARFCIPSCPRERGDGRNMPWWRSSLIFTVRKWVASTGIAPALSAGEADLLCSLEDKAKWVDETGFAPARAFAHEFLRLACIHSTTRRKMGADRGSRTLTSFRSPAPRAGVSSVPPRPQNWSIHRDVRPALRLTKAVRRFLRVGCKNGRSGRNRTFVAPEGGAFTARCNCCSATLRCMGARAGIAPATISL